MLHLPFPIENDILRIIKLHTTDSTNNYLKERIRTHTVENFTLVVSEEQTQGRGQMGTHWLSESGKNLTFSMYVRLEHFSIKRQFQLNQAISLGLLFALKKHIPQVKIKWPNDILADTKKIAGILIENTVSSSKIKYSIVGIGLNVNQTEFPKHLKQATSLRKIVAKKFDLDTLLLEIRDAIVQELVLLKNLSSDSLEKNYLEHLYLYQIPSIFSSKDNKKFTGTVTGIDEYGRLLIQKTTNECIAFGLKEVRFLV